MGNIFVSLTLGFIAGYTLDRTLKKYLEDHNEIYVVDLLKDFVEEKLKPEDNEEVVGEIETDTEEETDSESDLDHSVLDDVVNDPIRNRTPSPVHSRLSTPVNIDSDNAFKERIIEDIITLLNTGENRQGIVDLCFSLDDYVPDNKLFTFILNSNGEIVSQEYINNIYYYVTVFKNLFYVSRKVLLYKNVNEFSQ